MKQISVITNNRSGLVTEISGLLAEHNININSLDAAVVEDNAVVVLTVSEYDDAYRLLQSIKDVSVLTEDVILIKIADRPGALAKVAMRFSNADISIRSMRIIERGAEQSLVAISADRTKQALDIVKEYLIS
ncbi:hypothetical protein MNBD_GAMMA12-3671 [hydrothermal vent metagenome]|uniref:ACT domain-containing protein n=1 Tax=hydrothermal vent metagenome TaxID=652676 RepID=A0A3B0YI90_9ZZZZ